MIVKTSGHQHLFEKETTIKVPLRREKAGIVGHDIIKQRECKCGAKISYDLIRDGVDNGTDLQ